MNSAAPPPPDAGGLLGTSDLGGFGYGIGVSIGILLLITTITLASYYCTRTQLSQSPASGTNIRAIPGAGDDDNNMQHWVVDVGLDETTIKSYPKLLYSEARVGYIKKKADSTASCCSICLADYKGTDQLRQLPECNHLFHVKCVDPWLRLHPTCPVCRTSPLPTPVPTPLAEVTPLAAARRN